MRNVDANQFCHNLHFLVAKSACFTIYETCCKICSVAIYALLSEEKLKPKIVYVEKKDKYEV